MSPSATPATQSAAASRRLKPAQARRQSQSSAISATPATQSHGRCHHVPRLPRETTVDVTMCHACHAKRRWMSPSATPATQSAVASRRLKPARAPPEPVQCQKCLPDTHSHGRCHQVQRLPREPTVDVTQVPRLPRKTEVDVTKCHDCHAKCRGVTATKTGPSAPPEPAQCHKCHKCHGCHAKRRCMSPSATLARRNEGICDQGP